MMTKMLTFSILISSLLFLYGCGKNDDHKVEKQEIKQISKEVISQKIIEKSANDKPNTKPAITKEKVAMIKHPTKLEIAKNEVKEIQDIRAKDKHKNSKNTASIEVVKANALSNIAKSVAAVEIAKANSSADIAHSVASVESVKRDNDKTDKQIELAKAKASGDIAKAVANVEIAKAQATESIAKAQATESIANVIQTVEVVKAIKPKNIPYPMQSIKVAKAVAPIKAISSEEVEKITKQAQFHTTQKIIHANKIKSEAKKAAASVENAKIIAKRGNATKGQKLYLKKLKKACGINGAKFAAKHSQNEWKEIKDSGNFTHEIQNICPNVKNFKEKWINDIYEFSHQFAKDSGNVPSC